MVFLKQKLLFALFPAFSEKIKSNPETYSAFRTHIRKKISGDMLRFDCTEQLLGLPFNFDLFYCV